MTMPWFSRQLETCKISGELGKHKLGDAAE